MKGKNIKTVLEKPVFVHKIFSNQQPTHPWKHMTDVKKSKYKEMTKYLSNCLLRSDVSTWPARTSLKVQKRFLSLFCLLSITLQVFFCRFFIPLLHFFLFLSFCFNPEHQV